MPKLIAIDLGSHAVKATVYAGTARRMSLEGRYAQSVPQDGAATPSLELRLAALDALFEDHPDWKAGANTFAIAWPSGMATMHRITLPYTDKAAVERTLPFAVEAEVPFDLEDMHMSWRVVSSTTDTRALVALVRKEDMQSLLAELAGRRIDPKHVFIDADVLGYYAPRDRVVAVLDIGHAYATISVVRDGTVRWSRAINVGGLHFTHAVQIGMNTSWEDAERIKHGERPGDDEPTDPAFGAAELPDAARRALEAPIGLLLAEVRSTLISAEDTLEVEIEEVRVCGGGSKLAGLLDWLRQDLGVPVHEVVDPDGDPVPAHHAVSNALAARLSGQTRANEIDLRRGEFGWRGGGDLLRGVVLYGGAGMGVFLVAMLGLGLWQYVSLTREATRTQEALLTTVTSTLPGVDPSVVRDGTTAKAVLGEELEGMKARAAALGVDRDAPPTVDLLHALTTSFPPPADVTVDVQELTITPANVTFTAETDGYSGSAAVEEALKQSERFRTATTGNEKKVREKVQFTVTIPMGEQAAPGEEG